MSGKKHVHKHELKALGKDKNYWVYACVLPGCTHYLEQSLAFGKETICWRCGELTVIPKSRPGKRGVKRPVCMKCIRRKVDPNAPKIEVGKIADLSIEELLGGDTSGLFDILKSEDE